VTVAVGDSIRSKIGKPRKNAGQATGKKKTHGGSRSRSADELRGPGGDHGDRPPQGRCSAEAGVAARSRFGAALIACRTIEEERLRNMVDVLLSLSGEYI
jgi:hypothetical protein